MKVMGTDASRGADAKQHDVTAVGVVQQLDELMQHYGDGRHTHAMLGKKERRQINCQFFTCRQLSFLRNK